MRRARFDAWRGKDEVVAFPLIAQRGRLVSRERSGLL